MEMQNRGRAAAVEGEERRLEPRDGSRREEGFQIGRVQPQQHEHVVVRAIRKMKLVGLRQALKPGTSLLERLFWVGVFCVCMWYTIHLTWTSVDEYVKNPTSNTFHDDTNINFAPFPAVTVTGTMTFTSSGIDNAYEKLVDVLHGTDATDWTLEGTKLLLFAVDHFCEMVSSFASKFSFLNLSKTVNLKSIGDWVRQQNVVLRDDPSDPIMREKVMPFIRDNTLNCKSILLACMWEGTEGNCEDLFVPVQTDVGVGCSFNRIPEEILRTSEGLISLLRNRKTRISKDEWSDWKKWDMDVDLKSAIERLKSPRRFPRIQNAAGNMKGLSFLLLHDDVDKLSCPVMSSNGFLIGIHSPFEEPQMMKSGVAVPPGYEVLIKVKGELTIADKALQSLAIEKRNCLFQGETKLKLFSTYTLANCQKECLSKRIVSKCGCHQLSMSSGKNETICGPLNVTCVGNATRELDQDGYNQLCGDLKCLAPCNDINYETSVSYLPYHSKNIFDFSQTGSFELSSNASTSIVHVTYSSNRVTTRERKLLLGLAFLIGIIGGILGMTLEFSVASFFNVLAGLGVLVASVFDFRRFARLCSTSVNLRDEFRDPEGRTASTSVDNLSNDSEEGLDHRLTNLRDPMIQGLKETLLEDLRKTLMKDLRKTLARDLRRKIMRDLKKARMKDLKKPMANDLKTAREVGFQERGIIDKSCNIIDIPDKSITDIPDKSITDNDIPDKSITDRPNGSRADIPDKSITDRPNENCDDIPDKSITDRPNGSRDNIPDKSITDRPNENCDDIPDKSITDRPNESYDGRPDERYEDIPDETCDENLDE